MPWLRPRSIRRIHRRLTYPLATLGLVLACSGDDSVAPPVPCELDSMVTVAVTDGTVPRITWTPACGVTRLTVVEQMPSGPPFVRWSITAEDGRLASGVRYGQVPTNATETSEAEPLQEGRQYGIALYDEVGRMFGASIIAP